MEKINLIVNVGKTIIMINGVGEGLPTESGKWPGAVP